MSGDSFSIDEIGIDFQKQRTLVSERVQRLKFELQQAEEELDKFCQGEVTDAVQRISYLLKTIHSGMTEDQWAAVCADLLNFESHPHDISGEYWKVNMGDTPLFSTPICLAGQSVKTGGL